MTLATDSRAVIVADAEAIEHAEHVGLLRPLGFCTDAEVRAAVTVVQDEAIRCGCTVAALMAGDYDDNPGDWPQRWFPALWRSCQIHGAEDQYPALSRTAAVAR